MKTSKVRTKSFLVIPKLRLVCLIHLSVKSVHVSLGELPSKSNVLNTL